MNGIEIETILHVSIECESCGTEIKLKTNKECAEELEKLISIDPGLKVVYDAYKSFEPNEVDEFFLENDVPYICDICGTQNWNGFK
jgi:hypothetical protein